MRYENTASLRSCIVALLRSARRNACKRTDVGRAIVGTARAATAAVGDNYVITVPRGTRWTTIGIHEHAGYEQLRRANPQGLGGRRIFISGLHIVQTTVPNGLVLNLPELTLFFFQNGQATHWYPVAIGMVPARWHTPVGNFHIVDKEINPIWHRPPYVGGGTEPPGPHNPLGDRLMNVSYPGLGIHSTDTITSIGHMASHACIRMFPPLIHQLFPMVEVGMPVVITYDTVKVGQQNGIVYMAVFPDIYQMDTNTPEQVRTLLSKDNLDDVLSSAGIQAALAHADGIARPILGSTMPVSINGAAWQGPIGPTMRDGTLYLPLDALADHLGMQLTEDSDSVTGVYHGKSVTFPIDGHTAFRALDAVFISANSFAQAYGGAARVVGGTLNIHLPG